MTYIDEADTYRLSTVAVSSSTSSDAMKVDGEDGEVESAQQDNGLSYELYNSFWKLQSFFASDTKAIDKAETWTAFNDSARKALALLDKEHDKVAEKSTGSKPNARSSSSSGDANRNNAANGSGFSADETYLGSKYLTSSQLFSLQLKDSSVRQQLAVQVLYFIHYIR